MRRYKGLAIGVLLLLALVSVSTTVAQNSPPNVAILVVDVFEDPSVAPHPLSNPSETQCGISFDGNDGAGIQGNSVTSALHPWTRPHGDLVYEYFRRVLADEYNGTHDEPFPIPNNLEALIPGIEKWDVPDMGGSLWLVPVDTNQYEVQAIKDNIVNAVNALKDEEVNRFVINMSFGQVPCIKIPVISPQDYIFKINEWGIECKNDGLPLQRLACVIIDPDFGPESFINDLVNFREEQGAEAVAAYSFLQFSIMQPKVQSAFQPDPDFDAQRLPLTFVDQISSLAGEGIQIVQVASAGNDGASEPYYPAKADNVLSVSAYYVPSRACEVGNETLLVNYLKSLGLSSAAVSESLKRLQNPASNSGEVQENGASTIGPDFYLTKSLSINPDAQVLGCLVGTSFAAPRVSIQMAQYFINGNDVHCERPEIPATPATEGSPEIPAIPATSSEPPLNHSLFDNLSISLAAKGYCRDFPQ